MKQGDPYNVYLRAYGKAVSGLKITDRDFGIPSWFGRVQWREQAEQVAVAIAAQDMIKDQPLKSKSEFEAELQRMLA